MQKMVLVLFSINRPYKAFGTDNTVRKPSKYPFRFKLRLLLYT